MTIKPVTGYIAVCDGCLKTGATDDYAAWPDIDGAEESVRSPRHSPRIHHPPLVKGPMP